MRRLALGLSLIVLLALTMLSGCGGNLSSQSTQQQQKSGTVVMTGQDSPIPSVLSFQVKIDSITLGTGVSNGTVTGGQTLATNATVDFARFLGLRTLLGLQSVSAGTYSVAQIVLENPVISVLNLGPPPSVSTQTLPFSATGSNPLTLTIPLNPGMTVGNNGLAGVTMHFDLRSSMVTDTNGNITSVNPVITFRALQVPSDPDWEIDELRGTVMSVSAPNSFVLQRPDGRQFTIDVNGQTDYEGVASGIGNLQDGTLVDVSGQAQQDGSILADSVESYTTNHEFVEGIVLATNPASGAATGLTLLVRDQIPVVQGISIGNTANVAVSNATDFDIYHLNLPITQFLFNDSMMVAGQAVVVGGTVDNSTNPPTLDANRVVLHRQGIDGQAVAGTINLNTGTFQLQNNGFWGYVLSAPIPVVTTGFTQFINVSGLSAITPSMQLRVTGLVLRDGSGNPVLVAGRVLQVQ